MPDPTVRSTGVRRSSVSSRDADEVTEYIRQVYVGNRARFTAVRDRRASFDAVAADVPGLACSEVRSRIDYVASTEPFDRYLFFAVRRGSVRVRDGRDDIVVARGEVSFYPLGVPLEVEVDDVDVQVLTLAADRLDEVAADVAGVPPGTLVFATRTPASPALRGYWRSVSALVTGATFAPDSPMTSPLVAEEMIRTAAVAALHVFPNSTMSRVQRPGRAGPAALRRAVAYIEAHAQQPLTLADLAAAAGTSSRALQYAFRRHHGTTPLGYARRVRLDHAHRQLQAADPTRGDTVAAVAARWGFAKPDRFAAAYRDAYGVLPSHTLRR